MGQPGCSGRSAMYQYNSGAEYPQNVSTVVCGDMILIFKCLEIIKAYHFSGLIVRETCFSFSFKNFAHFYIWCV